MIRIHDKNAQVARFIPVLCRKKRPTQRLASGWRRSGHTTMSAATTALSMSKIQTAPSGICHAQRGKGTPGNLRPPYSKPSPRPERLVPFAATAVITNPIRWTATALSAYSAVLKHNNAGDCSHNEHLMTRLNQPFLLILFIQRINMLPLGCSSWSGWICGVTATSSSCS